MTSTVGSTKALRAESKPFASVAAQFSSALGAHGAAYSVAWIEQVRPASAVVDSFEERRTQLEKEARDQFETKDCFWHAAPDLIESVVKFGFSAALQGDAGTFALSPAAALAAAKSTADVAQNKDAANRLLLCRVSLGVPGKHHRVVGSGADARFVLTDVRGVVPSFLIGFRFNAHAGARSQPAETKAPETAAPAAGAATSKADDDDDDDAELAAEMARLKKHVVVSHQ